jgi:hypothetical protein
MMNVKIPRKTGKPFLITMSGMISFYSAAEGPTLESHQIQNREGDPTTLIALFVSQI